ncbi:MAG: methionyl-tRNA formyltransferase [Patescibacteria group bacterium]
MTQTRVLFFGTSDFAVPALERLAQDPSFSVIGVVTQPDRPVGRKAILTAPPIKHTAERLQIPVFQFEKVKSDEAFDALKSLNFDLAVVASFGQIIPQRVLDLAPRGFINIHGSILPKYRGASPIAGAIKAGETETGITIMLMDALMDHGPILAIARETIQPDDTTTTLSARLAQIGAETLIKTVVTFLSGDLKPQEQDHASATSVKLLKREDGLIDWTQNATSIERTVRAYDPWPGTYTIVEGKRLKILSSTVSSTTDRPVGSFFLADGQLAVACGEGTSLVITRVQPEGKAPMSGVDFVRGHQALLSQT